MKPIENYLFHPECVLYSPDERMQTLITGRYIYTAIFTAVIYC